MASRRNDIMSAHGESKMDESEQPSDTNPWYQRGHARGWAFSQPKYTEIYSVNLQDLPNSETAENLQRIITQQLGFKSVSVSDILMHTPQQTCWICNIKDKNVAIDLAKKWDSSEPLNRKRRPARVSVQEPEFCENYRTGYCQHLRCYFDHVPCTAENDNACPPECPRGHQTGIKERNTLISLDPYQNYRIRILGLPPNLEPQHLANNLGHRIPQQIKVRGDVVQIIQLKSIKYAKMLVDRVHNRPYIKGHIMKCQLELNVLGYNSVQQLIRTPTDSPTPRSLTPDIQADPLYRTDPGVVPEETGAHITRNEVDLTPINLPGMVNDVSTYPINVSINTVGPVEPQPHSANSHGISTVPKGALPLDVPRKWKKCLKTEVKPGGEGEVTKICLITDERTVAAIKVYRYDTQTRKMRAYREVTALNILSGVTNVSHLYPPEADPVTNIPDNLNDTLHKSDCVTFWTILAFIKGVTMKEYVTQRFSSQRGFSLLDALNFTEKLLRIVKAIQAKGIVHRDLKPDNIMVTFNKYTDPTENAELSVVDFGQAYIATQETTDIDWSKYDKQDIVTDIDGSIGNRWYRVPQLDRQNTDRMTDKEKNDLFYVIRRSPTIDASSICAIFFWMLTKIPPKENRSQKNLAPHQEYAADILKKIDDAMLSMPDLSSPERDTVKSRLQMYLMTTFDKGFEFPERQWTVEQLDYRLKLIRSVFDSSASGRTLRNASKRLLKLGDATFSSAPSFHEQRSPLDKAAIAFLFATTKFIENHPHNYKWTDSSCQWVDDVHDMAERKHYDILTYYQFNQSWSILVCCTANINETGQCSVVHWKYRSWRLYWDTNWTVCHQWCWWF